MSVVQISRAVNSAELARVREVTRNGASRRSFEVTNDGEKTPAIVMYAWDSDNLYCSRCNTNDDCTHTARIRLCGILTGSVNPMAGIERVKR